MTSPGRRYASGARAGVGAAATEIIKLVRDVSSFAISMTFAQGDMTNERAVIDQKAVRPEFYRHIGSRGILGDSHVNRETNVRFDRVSGGAGARRPTSSCTVPTP